MPSIAFKNVYRYDTSITESCLKQVFEHPPQQQNLDVFLGPIVQCEKVGINTIDGYLRIKAPVFLKPTAFIIRSVA